MSLELRGGQSPKNAKGVRGQSWKNSEMFSEQKTGHPLITCMWMDMPQRLKQKSPLFIESDIEGDWGFYCYISIINIY